MPATYAASPQKDSHSNTAKLHELLLFLVAFAYDWGLKDLGGEEALLIGESTYRIGLRLLGADATVGDEVHADL
jgi:hypothetical protein